VRLKGDTKTRGNCGHKMALSVRFSRKRQRAETREPKERREKARPVGGTLFSPWDPNDGGKKKNGNGGRGISSIWNQNGSHTRKKKRGKGEKLQEEE